MDRWGQVARTTISCPEVFHTHLDGAIPAVRVWNHHPPLSTSVLNDWRARRRTGFAGAMFCMQCVGKSTPPAPPPPAPEPPTAKARLPKAKAPPRLVSAEATREADEEKAASGVDSPRACEEAVRKDDDSSGVPAVSIAWSVRSWVRSMVLVVCALLLARRMLVIWREFTIAAIGALIGVLYARRKKSLVDPNDRMKLKAMTVPSTGDGKKLQVEWDSGTSAKAMTASISDERVAMRMARAVQTLEATAAGPQNCGWSRWGIKSGVDIWLRTDPVTGIKNSVGMGTVDGSASAVADAIESEECKAKFDGQWKRTSVLRICDKRALEARLGPELRVLYFVVQRDEYKPVFPASARDCVVSYCRLHRIVDDAVLLCLTSVLSDDDARAHSHAADDANYVRMHISVGGYICKPAPNHKTEIISLVDLDPKGFVPRAVVNFVAVDRPIAIARLRSLLPLTTNMPVATAANDKEDNDSELDGLVAAALDALVAADRDPEASGFVSTPGTFDDLAVYMADNKYVLTRGPVRADVQAVHNIVCSSASTLDKMREHTTLLKTFGRQGDQIGADGYQRMSPTSCFRIAYKPIFPTSPRDAVIAITDVRHPITGTQARVSTSIQLPDAQLDPERVRMTVVVNGWMFKCTDDANTSLATNIYKVEPNGGLPKRLLGRLAKARIKQIPTLRILVLTNRA